MRRGTAKRIGRIRTAGRTEAAINRGPLVRKSLTVKSVTTGAVAMSNSGSWLRERREELHLSRSGVERLTGESANKAADERYRIRRGRLTGLEASRSAPDIFEVASLCECYKVNYPAVLQ